MSRLVLPLSHGATNRRDFDASYAGEPLPGLGAEPHGRDAMHAASPGWIGG